MTIDEASMHEYKRPLWTIPYTPSYYKKKAREKRFSQAARCQSCQSFREVRKWVGGHQDTVRGEDLQVELCQKFMFLNTHSIHRPGSQGIRASMVWDQPQTGSAAKAVRPGACLHFLGQFSYRVMHRYGGYPCGLWSLWHSLTISQAAAHTGDPRFLKPVYHSKQMKVEIKNYIIVQM